MANGTSDGPLQEDERAELARLREEVATLRGQTPSARETTVEKVSRPPRHGLRWTAVTILLVLVALLAVLSVTTRRSEEHTSELQSLMRNSYALFCSKNNTNKNHK